MKDKEERADPNCSAARLFLRQLVTVLDETQFAALHEVSHQPVAGCRTDPEHLCGFREREPEPWHFAKRALHAVRELTARRRMMREASTESSTLRSSGKLYVMTLQALLRLIFRVFGDGHAASRAVKVEIETSDEVMLRLREGGEVPVGARPRGVGCYAGRIGQWEYTAF
jgi:hypothetical protein